MLKNRDDVYDAPDLPAFPEDAPAAVRQLLRRATRLAATGFTLFAIIGMVWGIGLYRAADLLATGSRTTGEVVGTYKSSYYSDSILVLYEVERTRYIERIMVDSAVLYPEHTELVVIYDPASPTRIRAETERNLTSALQYLVSSFGLVGAAALLYGLVGMTRWYRRLRPARTQHWREGTAVLRKHPVGYSRTHLTVRFKTGQEEEFLTNFGVVHPIPPSLLAEKAVTVWVNGTGPAVTVMFAYGPFLVAAKPAQPA